jgi:nitrogen fixation NifU-like protein
MDDLLRELYEDVILVHSTSPYRFYEQKDASYHLQAYNYFCGDRYDLYFEVVDGYIRQLSFYGNGCAISKAATSILVQSMNDQPIAYARTLLEQYDNYLKDTSGVPPTEETAVFAALQHYPARKTCAQLSWQTLHTFLKQHSL